MQPAIINAKNKNLFGQSSNLPDVSAAIMGMLYPMVFERMQNTIVNGYAQNVPIKFTTLACVQPFTAQMLKIKPEGERNWKWFTIHALTDLTLHNNDKIKIDGVQYKIMEKFDWSRNGYTQYNAIEYYVSDGTNNS